MIPPASRRAASRGPDPVPADGDAPGLPARPLVHHVDLRPGGMHAQPEARQLAVPDHNLAIGGGERLDEAGGERFPVRTRHG